MITCTFENGKQTPRLRHVVVDALIVKNNSILLVKRAPHLINGGKFALPGGFLDRDETLEKAVCREATEETGWEVTVDRLLCISDSSERGDDRQNVAFFYIAKPLNQVSLPDKEVSEAKWFNLKGLPDPQKIAFDHYDIIQTYKNYLREPFPLPLFLTKRNH